MESIERRRRERNTWTDDRLTTDLARAAADERHALIELLLDLAEFDKRTLGEPGGYSSLFDYCTRKLGYASSEAGRRIAVARKGDEFPMLLNMIERGELHLSGAAMLAGVLTSENHTRVLRKAKGKTLDEVARLVAALAPRRVPKEKIRPLRVPPEAVGLPASPAAPQAAATGGAAPDADLFGAPAAESAPRAEPELYSATFILSGETRALLERAKEVLRHRFPKAGTDEILNFALKRVLAETDRDLRKPPRPPKPEGEGARRSRYIPEAIKQEAWERDGGQCAYVAPDGTRCSARAWLEFDHEVPYALGGDSRDVRCVRPYCYPHNKWAAKQAFRGSG